MKTILITGANGQLGNEMRLLVGRYPAYRYLFTDVAELDICDAEAVKDYVAEQEVDLIVNCAAYTAVDKAEDDEALADRLNHLAPGYLAEAVAARGGNLIQISTDYVFDGTSYVPYREDMLACPDSVYGRTKLAGEEAAMSHCKNVMVIRTAWLYSTFGNNFVKTMIRLGREKDSLGVIFDQIGTPTYARDLARVIFVVIEKGIIPGIYHFSNEGVCSWYDFTQVIHRLAGIADCKLRPLHTEEYPTRAKRPHYSVLDKTKLKETYGIAIPYWIDSLEECIKKLLA